MIKYSLNQTSRRNTPRVFLRERDEYAARRQERMLNESEHKGDRPLDE